MGAHVAEIQAPQRVIFFVRKIVRLSPRADFKQRGQRVFDACGIPPFDRVAEDSHRSSLALTISQRVVRAAGSASQKLGQTCSDGLTALQPLKVRFARVAFCQGGSLGDQRLEAGVLLPHSNRRNRLKPSHHFAQFFPVGREFVTRAQLYWEQLRSALARGKIEPAAQLLTSSQLRRQSRRDDNGFGDVEECARCVELLELQMRLDAMHQELGLLLIGAPSLEPIRCRLSKANDVLVLALGRVADERGDRGLGDDRQVVRRSRLVIVSLRYRMHERADRGAERGILAAAVRVCEHA